MYLLDNGSEEDISASLLREFPSIHLKRLYENRGYAGGFNAALNWVFFEGKYDNCLFLTNDTLLQKDSLKNLLTFQKENRLDMVSPLLISARDHAKIDSNGGLFCDRTLELQHIRELGKDYLLSKNEYIPGTALLISRDSFDQLGGCDESYFMYWEDVDLSFRAHREGFRLGRCENAVIEHGIGKTCHKKAIYTTFYYQRNRIKFAKAWLNSDQWKSQRDSLSNQIKEKKKFYADGDQKRLDYWNEIERFFQALE